MDIKILPADLKDIAELAPFVDSCYRGDSSRKGWTTGADLVDGSRANPAMLQEEMDRPGAVILKCVDNSTGRIIGCAYTEKQTDDKLYTGMLCVQPELQTNGLGKTIMRIIEQMAKDYKCSIVEIHVVSRRKELVEWYERRGYNKTGKTIPYPTDGRYGEPNFSLDFAVMQKNISI